MSFHLEIKTYLKCSLLFANEMLVKQPEMRIEDSLYCLREGTKLFRQVVGIPVLPL